MDSETRERLLAEAEKEENKKPVKGYTASSFEKDGKLVAGFEKNIKGGGTPRWHNPGTVIGEIERPEKPAKRTHLQQSQALGARLWDSARADPVQWNLLMHRIQGELWAQGKACSFEDVQHLAGELLAVAEAKAKATRS